MKLIKQLNEVAKTSMDRDTFDRLVDMVVQDVQENSISDEHDILEVIYGLIENVAGFEDVIDATKLAGKVFIAVKKRLG